MKQWRVFVAGIITLVLSAFVVVFSKTTQQCVSAIPNYETHQKAHEGASYVAFSLLAKVGCLGIFVDANANAIIALFTIVLTISTVAMWWETRKMASGGEEHARDMKASIAAAQTAANAAKSQAVTARRQALIQEMQSATLRKQKDLQALQLNSLHRPRLIIREVYWFPQESGVNFILVNQGVNTATVVESRFEFDRTDDQPIIPSGENALGKGFDVLGGEFKPITVPLGEQHGLTLGAFDMGLFTEVRFQGVIIYRDDSGTQYRLVFKRVCTKGQSLFARTGNPDDEYSD